MRKVIVIFVVIVILFYTILLVWFSYKVSEMAFMDEYIEEIITNIDGISNELRNNEKAFSTLIDIKKKLNFILVSKEDLIKNNLNIITRSVGISFIAFLIVSMFVSFILTQPLRVLVNFIKDIKFPFNGSVPRFIFRDINLISTSFESLLKKLEDYEKRIRDLERFEGWREVAKVMVHEVGNLITPAYVSIENAILNSRNLNYEETQKLFTILNNMKKFLEKIREISSIPTPEMKKENIVSILLDIKSFMDFEIEIEGSQEKYAMCDKTLLVSAFTNILKNSLEAVKNTRGSTKVKIWDDNENIFISFWDNGGGITKETLENLFNFGFSLKGKDRGIGLYITKKIILDHNGNITVNSNTTQGTTEFIISIPKLTN